MDINAHEAQFDIDSLFHANYDRVARIIARVVRDPACAEELAVEVFLKLWRNSHAQNNHLEAWLYRVALRAALDELRWQSRRRRSERLPRLSAPSRVPQTPNNSTAKSRSHRPRLP